VACSSPTPTTRLANGAEPGNRQRCVDILLHGLNFEYRQILDPGPPPGRERHPSWHEGCRRFSPESKCEEAERKQLSSGEQESRPRSAVILGATRYGTATGPSWMRPSVWVWVTLEYPRNQLKRLVVGVDLNHRPLGYELDSGFRSLMLILIFQWHDAYCYSQIDAVLGWFLYEVVAALVAKLHEIFCCRFQPVFTPRRLRRHNFARALTRSFPTFVQTTIGQTSSIHIRVLCTPCD